MEYSFLLACLIFLSAAVIVVPLAKLTGLGPVLGYLLAGVIIGPYALGLVADPKTIFHFSEFGVVMMLFLIGLELQPREFWHMRVRLVGLGVPQVIITALLIAGFGIWLNLPWQSAVVMGLGLSLSSTAIVLKIIDERSIMQRSVGRSAFSVLLVQDVAVIPFLAIIPFLVIPELANHAPTDAHGAVPTDEGGWQAGLRVTFVFSSMYLAGRYLLRPVLKIIAKSGVREIFTALALLLVVAAALMMEWINISPALGAFMIGVILADSEYRHQLESDLEPFKGLLLGLFFISVGMSIEFSVFLTNAWSIIGLVLGLATLKFAVLFGLATIFKFHIADRLLFATLLAQGGEFAFVLFQFALGAGALDPGMASILNVTVALSMIITPILLIVFDRIVVPRLPSLQSVEREDDDISVRNRVIVLGYGRFGQIVTRLLTAQGYEATLIDHDPEQIELMKKFDAKVFYGDARRLDLLKSAGADKAELMVISIHSPEIVSEISRMVRENFPHIRVLARARDRNHAHDLMDIGVHEFERDTFHSALQLGIKALVTLGYTEAKAKRLANAFAKHDVEMLHEAYELRGDDEAMIGHVKTARQLLAQVMQADIDELDADQAVDKNKDNK
ncbi:monovalent cation:proton antiporter-2 (CPA2) family protein [Maritalea porphyrae]|jgi:glutathione-regulated potassium-efflux system ancillary protein KefC|uniref:monovalent cation:proton antiporter-2 (CPA2) family protein n=2 Tax=Maritalea TaxID=623276 RepID=UPI0022AF9A65|nr:monovalent cation:proton antiporter-2 (CPA2) family protein [Maritalea porphyrae]MCZ4273728.1 monovalent cation:proton antiporter-2 (CPA2) family protein [Maritalea porphyrae]